MADEALEEGSFAAAGHADDDDDDGLALEGGGGGGGGDAQVFYGGGDVVSGGDRGSGQLRGIGVGVHGDEGIVEWVFGGNGEWD